MNPIETAARVREIGDQARGVFIGRDDLVQGIELALVSGLHAIVLGPPGTGNSAAIRARRGAGQGKVTGAVSG